MLSVPTDSHTMQYANWTRTMRRSVLRQMIAVVSQPGILSLAGGLPAPELFPTEGYASALADVLAEDPRALQYAPPFQPLKEHIVAIMALRGIHVTADQVFLTTGAQQALHILAQLFIDPGRAVLLEEMIYTGVQQAVFPREPRILSVPTDLEHGIDTTAVEDLLQRGERPAFIYTIPEGHNPLGVSMTLATRRRLIELAAAYDVPLIEDDPYGLLTYDDEMLPPLRALTDEGVFYVGSCSKILMPALRLGWMVVPESLLPKLTVIKEAMDLESASLTQRAVAAYLDTGAFPAHLARLRAEYGRRRDAMLAALQAHFPAEARWTRPRSGMFVWVELPEHVDTELLLETAVARERVAFIPGHAFAVPGRVRKNTLRLTFASSSAAKIEEGVARLAAVIREA